MRRTSRKLSLSTSTLRVLTGKELELVGGGWSATLSTVYTSSQPQPQPQPTTDTLHCPTSLGDPWPDPPPTP